MLNSPWFLSKFETVITYENDWLVIKLNFEYLLKNRKHGKTRLWADTKNIKDKEKCPNLI